MKNLIWILLFFLSATSLRAQDEVVKQYMGTITSDDLRKELSIFASDDFEGRNTGTVGADAAALYLADGFKASDLVALCNDVSNPYFQPVELYKTKTLASYIEANGVKLNNTEDIFIMNSPNGTSELSLVFAGFGKNGKNYPAIDVKGKVVVMCTGEPVNAKGIYLTTGTDQPEFPAFTDFRSLNTHMAGRMEYFLKQGAEGFIVLEADAEKLNSSLGRMSRYLGGERVGPKNAAPRGGGRNGQFFAISSVEKALPVLGMNAETYTELMKAVEAGKEFPYDKYTAKITSVKEISETPVRAQNVAGLLEGGELKDEVIVVSAHYDHLGTSPQGVFNGADDNGSGSVALLELSKIFNNAKKAGYTPKRSILFIGYTGEEEGLLGSRFYADHTLFPVENTYANINIDMISRIDEAHENDPNFLYSIGSDFITPKFREVFDSVDKAFTPELKLDYAFNSADDPNHFYTRSDHYPLASKGVPSVFLFSGEHEDYHKVTDDVEKVNFPQYELRVKMIFATLWKLANMDENLK